MLSCSQYQTYHADSAHSTTVIFNPTEVKTTELLVPLSNLAVRLSLDVVPRPLANGVGTLQIKEN